MVGTRAQVTIVARTGDGESPGCSPSGKKGQTIMWARRLIISSGLAVESLTVLSGAAGAAGCASAGSMTQPGCVVPPTAGGGAQGVAPASVPHDPTPAKVTPVSTGPTSLPFTGADIEELAVVGAGAVLAGGLLLRRRRHTLA